MYGGFSTTGTSAGRIKLAWGGPVKMYSLPPSHPGTSALVIIDSQKAVSSGLSDNGKALSSGARSLPWLDYLETAKLACCGRECEIWRKAEALT